MRASFLCLAAFALSCAATPRKTTTPPANASATSDAARWHLPGTTTIGPLLKEGRLILLGGRRALIRADGTVHHEATPSPEPLEIILQVPSVKGPRLIGASARGVYRFDDPLGAPTVLAHARERFGTIAAGPGMVQVYADDMKPLFIDVDTGKTVPWKGAPEGAAGGMAFVSMQHGLARMNDQPLVTTDGGVSFRPLKGPAVSDGQPLRLSPKWHEGELRVLVQSASALQPNEWAEVDFASATLRIAPTKAPAEDSMLARFVRRVKADPLELAAATGLLVDPQHALIGVGGYLARVDLRTGDIVDLAEYTPQGETDSSMPPCQLERAQNRAWAECKIASFKSIIFSMPLEGKLARPEQTIRGGVNKLASSPSGGFLYRRACANDKIDAATLREKDPYACVLQPDGQWKTFFQPRDPERKELYPDAGPLKNGLVAALVISYPVHPGEVAKEANFVLVNAPGEAKELAPIKLEGVEGNPEIDTYVEEDALGVLRVVVSDDAGVFVVEQPPNGAGLAKRLERARWANLHAGHGVAVGEGAMWISNDAGANFIELSVPKGYRKDLGDLDAQHWVDAYRAAKMPVSEAGFSLDSTFRMRWDVSPEKTPEVKLQGGVFIDVPPSPPANDAGGED